MDWQEKLKSPYFLIGLLAIIVLYSAYQLGKKQNQADHKTNENSANITSLENSITLLPIIDKQLFACIKQAILDSAYSDRPLQDAKALRQLYCANHQVNSLDGIEALTQLEFIDISHNNIDDLRPLSKLKKLQSINLRHNPINDIQAILTLPDLMKLQLPNMPKTQCKALSQALSGIQSNIESIRCKKKLKNQQTRKQYSKQFQKRNESYRVEREIERFEEDY